MSWLSTICGFGCGLLSASVLGAGLLPWGTGRSQPVPGEVLIQAPPQQIQFYYTPWGTASVVRPPLSAAAAAPNATGPEPSWHWEESSLYHFTKPGPGTAIGHSPAGRKLAEMYDSGLNLLVADNSARVYASFTGGAYNLNAVQRDQLAAVESAQLNFLPEPSPLALLVTGIVCIFFARSLRRSRRTP